MPKNISLEQKRAHLASVSQVSFHGFLDVLLREKHGRGHVVEEQWLLLLTLWLKGSEREGCAFGIGTERVVKDKIQTITRFITSENF